MIAGLFKIKLPRHIDWFKVIYRERRFVKKLILYKSDVDDLLQA